MSTKLLISFLFLKLVASYENDFIFNGFGGSNLSLNGTAEITSRGLVQLTNNSKVASGRAFYLSPFTSRTLAVSLCLSLPLLCFQ